MSVRSAYRLLEFSWSKGHPELVVRVMLVTRPVVLGFSFFALASWRLLLLLETQAFENTFVPLDVGESLELILRQVRGWIVCGFGGFGSGGVGGVTRQVRSRRRDGVKENIEIVCGIICFIGSGFGSDGGGFGGGSETEHLLPMQLIASVGGGFGGDLLLPISVYRAAKGRCMLFSFAQPALNGK